MSWRRWLITIISFAAAIGVSLWIIFRSWPVEDRSVGLPLLAHALCVAAVALDLILRAMKIRLSGASLGIPVTFGVAMRTGLAGDFAAAITPARTGAEPARYLVLAKARITPAGTFLLLFAELFLEMLALVIVAMGIALLFTEEPDTASPGSSGSWEATRRSSLASAWPGSCSRGDARAGRPHGGRVASDSMRFAGAAFDARCAGCARARVSCAMPVSTISSSAWSCPCCTCWRDSRSCPSSCIR